MQRAQRTWPGTCPQLRRCPAAPAQPAARWLPAAPRRPTPPRLQDTEACRGGASGQGHCMRHWPKGSCRGVMQGACRGHAGGMQWPKSGFSASGQGHCIRHWVVHHAASQQGKPPGARLARRFWLMEGRQASGRLSALVPLLLSIAACPAPSPAPASATSGSAPAAAPASTRNRCRTLALPAPRNAPCAKQCLHGQTRMRCSNPKTARASLQTPTQCSGLSRARACCKPTSAALASWHPPAAPRAGPPPLRGLGGVERGGHVREELRHET